MISKSKVPQIRFKGFSGEWIEKNLDEILEVLDGDRGHNYPKENHLKKEGHTLFLSASNVTSSGFKFNDKKYITKTKSDDMGNGKIEIDDIILTSRGSLGHIAWYNQEIQQKIPFARINSGMLLLRTKNLIKPSFVSHFLKSPLGKKKIDLISFGSAQPQLTKKDVSKYKLNFSQNQDEQTKIGNYFQQLDKLIEQKEKKYQKLKQFKKAMLDKMFPKNGADTPEIRFKGFSGKWEEKKLDEISSAIFDGTHETPTYTDSGIPFFSVENLISKSKNKYISNKDHIEATKKNKPEKNDILITRIGNIGFSKVVTWDYDFSIYVTLAVVKQSKIFDSLYLNYYIQSAKYQAEIVSKSLLSAVPCKINMNELRNTNIILPKSLLEQEKIGNYFQKLDKQIDLQLQELKKLKNIKKASLSKMFV